jgi:hypothetical protein
MVWTKALRPSLVNTMIFALGIDASKVLTMLSLSPVCNPYKMSSGIAAANCDSIPSWELKRATTLRFARPAKSVAKRSNRIGDKVTTAERIETTVLPRVPEGGADPRPMRSPLPSTHGWTLDGD